MRIDIEALLKATEDLESGHSVEAVLKEFQVPEGYSAYDVVRRHQQDLEYLRTAVGDFYKAKWKEYVADLKPVVKAIADHLAGKTS